MKEIRALERRLYQQTIEIFKDYSINHNNDSQITKNFYATVQNKLHYAIIELIKKDNMGL